MKVNLNPAKGMRDFTPFEKEIRDYVENIIISTYKQSGFELIETPVVENIENLIGSKGGENLSLIFKILKRGDKLNLSDENLSENDLCDLGLRYDLTVPLSRFYCNNHAKLPSVFKALQVGNVFRAERAQKGRYRSLKQCDIDIIGDGSKMAELELITTTAKALNNLNVKDFIIRFNDRRILKSVVLFCGFFEDEFDGVCIVIDKMDKIGVDGVKKELLQKNYSKENVDKLIYALENINNKKTACLYEYNVDKIIIEEVEDLLNSVREYSNGSYDIEFDFTLIRGMGYYTGSIFEISYKDLGYSIGGGGRYDEMVGNLIGQKIPAIGFSIGFERLVDELIKENFKVPNLKKIVFLYSKDNNCLQIMKEADNLRNEGYSVSLYEKSKKMGKQLSQFEELGFTGFATLNNDTIEVKEF